MTARFGRVITAMVTPFTDTGALDEPRAAELVDWLFDHGSDGLVVCGTTGESPSLTHSEKVAMFRAVVARCAGRGPVIANTGNNDTASSIALTREALDCGVDAALLVVPPYNKPSQEGLYRHFSAIAGAVPSLPCILYNVPSRTSRNLDASTVIRLSADVPNIVGIKEASGDLVQVSEICSGTPPSFEVYSGEDALTLPMLAVGAVGVVSVPSHVAGREIGEMHRLFFDGNYAAARAMHERLMPLIRAMFQSTTPSPAPVKAAMAMAGLPVGGLRLPLVEVNAAERSIVATAMAGFAAAVAAA